MLVLLDMEWVKNAETQSYPTQISAMRVDEEWTPIDRYDCLVKPSDVLNISLSQTAYKGVLPIKYMYADSATDVFTSLYDWFNVDDVLCWWDQKSVSAFIQATHYLLQHIVGHDLKALDSIWAKSNQRLSGSDLYTVARLQGLVVPHVKLPSRQDVEIMQALLIVSETSWKNVLSIKSCFDTTDELRDSSSEEESSYSTEENEEKDSVVMPGATRALTKAEKKAYARYTLAMKERASLMATKKEMTPQQSKDAIRLTHPSFVFWAARGYKNFHLHNCPKLEHISDLRGFSTYNQAIKSGLTPCRQCRPTSKHDLAKPVPKKQHERGDESTETLDSICNRHKYKHNFDGSVYYIETSVGKWKIYVNTKPIDVYHINLVRTPGNEEYHLQQKLFLSLQDTLSYIIEHDRNIRNKISHDQRAY